MSGRLWCADLPTVTVHRGHTPKRVTIVYPFYEAHRFLADHVGHFWQMWAEDLCAFVSVIVVDDGSPRPLARMLPAPVSTRIFRIDVDVPWNWLAARNIGAHHAEDGWLLLTDIDHVVPDDTLRSLVFGKHDPNVVYAFNRYDATKVEMVAPHSASFFMTRAMFWKVGGYDERLSGVYGTDGLYRRRLAATAPIQILTDTLVRYEYVADSSVTTYERKTPAMRAAKQARLATLKPGKPKTLSFPYHEVTA